MAGQPTPADLKQLAAAEAKAVAEATASADESFIPSPSLLNSASPDALMEQVDGPSLSRYETKESVYVGKSVPVALRATLEVPIHVTAPGSVVEYSIETKLYDIGFAITAEREEGVTIVKEQARVDSHLESVTGKFLVGSVPCLLKFNFDNEYSWFREKLLSYRITVSPPSVDLLLAGRRRRAKACFKAIQQDLAGAQERYDASSAQKSSLEAEIAKLQLDLQEKQTKLEGVSKETGELHTRVELRKDQLALLDERLKKGWKDEEEANGK